VIWAWTAYVATLALLPPSWRQDPQGPDAVPGRYGEFLTQFEGLPDPVDLAFAPDGRLLVLLGQAGALVAVEPARAELFGGLEDPTALDVLGSTARVADLAHGLDGALGAEWWELDLATADAAAGGRALAARHPVAIGGDPGWGDLLIDAALREVTVDQVDGERRVLAEPLLEPADAAFLPDGRVAVVDASLHEVLVFDRAGAVELRFGDFGHFPGQLSRPSGIEVRGERIYVADTHNHRIQVRSLDGGLLYEWGKHALLPRQGQGHLHYPTRLAISPDRSRVAVLEPIEGRVQLFGLAQGPAGDYRTDPATLSIDSVGHFGPSIAASGRYAVTLEPETQELHVHDLQTDSGTPVLVGRTGGYGAGPGRFRGLADVGFAPEGDLVWVVDGRDLELAAFVIERDPLDEPPRFRRDRLRYTASVELRSLLPDLGSAVALAVDADGSPMVLDSVRGGVARVSEDLTGAEWVLDWSPGVDGPLVATDVALDPSGGLELAGRRRLWRAAGPSASLEPHAELRAGGLAFDGDGGRWVTDRDGHRIVGPAGSLGSGPGLGRVEFRDPRGLALVDADRLIVVDHGNHRLQVLSRDGELLGLAGPRPYLREALRRPAPTSGESER
jgi:hypothetical protein